MSSEETKKEILKQLFEKYEQSMYKVAYAVLHNDRDAEDVVADSFIKIASCLDRIKDINCLETKKFIFCIVRNTAINRFRRNMYESKIFLHIENDSSILYSDDNKDNYSESEQLETFNELINKLPYSYQQILLLRCFYELSYDEIAKRLLISISTARKRFERAKKMLKKLY